MGYIAGKIDLRGNGGGYTETLSKLVSHFFDKEIKIADLKSRIKLTPERAGTLFPVEWKRQ